jgi:hypothetical protein
MALLNPSRNEPASASSIASILFLACVSSPRAAKIDNTEIASSMKLRPGVASCSCQRLR